MKFDEKLKELQQIADSMENEEYSIDESVELYEKGNTIAKECLKYLTETKGKITILKKDLEKYKEENFN